MAHKSSLKDIVIDSTKKNLVIYGAGEMGAQFACVHRDLKLFNEYKLHGFIDDNKYGTHCGLPILGNFSSAKELINSGIDNIFVSLLYDAGKRLDKCLELEQIGYNFPSLTNFPQEGHRYFSGEHAKLGKGILIHDSVSFIGATFDIGDFSVISAQAVIDSGAVIGKGTIVNPQAFISYNAKIGDGTMIYPGAKINTGVNVGSRCTIYPGVFVYKDMPEGSVKMKNEYN